jgi:hypothetical protein
MKQWTPSMSEGYRVAKPLALRIVKSAMDDPTPHSPDDALNWVNRMSMQRQAPAACRIRSTAIMVHPASRKIIFLDAKLKDGDGRLLATAASMARLAPLQT